MNQPQRATTTGLIPKGVKQKAVKEFSAHDHLDTPAMTLILFIGVFIGLLIRWRRSDRRFTANGYVLKRSDSGHDRYEHREIAENILGRQLEVWEVVHHINGRRSDNRPSNLCIMDRRDHDRYHEWYNWVFSTYGRYPRRETQLRKLRETFKGNLLTDFVNKRSGAG